MLKKPKKANFIPKIKIASFYLSLRYLSSTKDYVMYVKML